MIINFSVRNFHSIKDEVQLSFEASGSKELEDFYVVAPKKGLRLLKLGLIYGANASGKTTILKALDFLRDLILNPLDKKTDAIQFKPFLFDENTPNESSFFSLEFIQNKVKYFYKIELNRSAIIGEELYFFKPNKALVYKRKTNISKQISKIEFGSKLKINRKYKANLEANTLWNNTVLGGFLKTNFDSIELQNCIDWFETKLKPLITPKTNLLGYISEKLETGEVDKFRILEILKKADFNISDIIFREKEEEFEEDLTYLGVSIVREKIARYLKKNKEKEVYFGHRVEASETQYALPYDEESHGTQRYYQFSGLLDFMISHGSVFSIDELESSLHPDLLKHFILTFLVNVKNSQMIATTHYRELLMERDILRNDVIWFTEKNTNGATELFSLDDFGSSIVRNTSSIFNAYKTGKLGAVPELKDYYIDREDGKERQA